MNIEWNKVTWYSKLLAVVLFVVVFGIGFCFGRQYQQIKQQNQSVITWPKTTARKPDRKVSKIISTVFPETGLTVYHSDTEKFQKREIPLGAEGSFAVYEMSGGESPVSRVSFYNTQSLEAVAKNPQSHFEGYQPGIGSFSELKEAWLQHKDFWLNGYPRYEYRVVGSQPFLVFSEIRTTDIPGYRDFFYHLFQNDTLVVIQVGASDSRAIKDIDDTVAALLSAPI